MLKLQFIYMLCIKKPLLRLHEQGAHLQHGPEQDDDSDAAHLHELLAGVLATQLLSHTGPALPVRHQVAGLQAGLRG